MTDRSRVPGVDEDPASIADELIFPKEMTKDTDPDDDSESTT